MATIGLPALLLAGLLPGVVPGSTAAAVGAPLVRSSAVASPTGPIDTTSEAAVRTAYQQLWASAASTSIVPTGGSTSSCTTFTTSAAAQSATQNAINFARGLAGENGVSLQAGYNSAAASSALIMAASGRLSHSPDSSFSCWTQAGKDAAGRSNILIDSTHNPSAARTAKLYLDDSDASNTAVGHRRWLLRPEATTMGSGNAQSGSWFGNSIYVFTFGDDNAAAPAKAFYAWPSAGFFPTQLEPAGRWSLSTSSGGSFANAHVSVTGPGGNALAVHQYAPENGYADNTLTWDVSGVAGTSSSSPSTYTVTVSGISGAAASSYTYYVRLFDPTAAPQDLVLPADGGVAGRTTTRTVISVSHHKVRRHRHVGVRLGAVASNGQAVSGRFVIYVGRHKVRTFVLRASSRSTRVLRLAFDTPGNKRVRAVFKPYGAYASSRSAVRIRVR
ncbi:CAP domain-containing protein [Nocardioides mangrovicus]|uniref:CAP domain-containing protein n=1 Tax=Nocardioides mangrovicus TaxID=2478913 RepID=A0A3L8P5L3_9ACTN|nr:CAP domain-containing protein [Nocardioides mangrovicus]RLV50063.1 CAP domain-containing protein [Nocardioides mangrovicus]